MNGETKTTNFIQKCKEQSKILPMGGENVASAVLAVFCALVWHTQQLREDLEKYGKLYFLGFNIYSFAKVELPCKILQE